MQSAPRNDEMLDLLQGEFQRRYEPNFAWGNAVSMYLGLQGLLSYYPMGVMTKTGALTWSLTDVANGFNLQFAGATIPQATSLGLAAIMSYGNSGYHTYGADNAHFDVLGTESGVGSTQRGWTAGGWFRPSTLGGTTQGLISKYGAAGQRSYLLNIHTTNTFRSVVSGDGTAVVTVDSTAPLSINNWYFAVARYDPSTFLKIYVNRIEDTNAVAIPASLFNSTEPFMLGCTAGAGLNLYSGYMAHVFLCSSVLVDAHISTLFQQTRALFNV